MVIKENPKLFLYLKVWEYDCFKVSFGVFIKIGTAKITGILVFIGSFIFALIYTGNDRFLKRCLANGNSVKYCNSIDARIY